MFAESGDFGTATTIYLISQGELAETRRPIKLFWNWIFAGFYKFYSIIKQIHCFFYNYLKQFTQQLV